MPRGLGFLGVSGFGVSTKTGVRVLGFRVEGFQNKGVRVLGFRV